MLADRKKLNAKAQIPILGLGTWQLKDEDAREAVFHALEIGYRHIDTAVVYANHMEIGKVLDQTKIKRDELFITTKIWRTDLAYQDVKDSFSKALDDLKIDYVNLLLVHWPNENIPLAETFKAMGELKKEGLIKAIGVSNFTITHLEGAQITAKAVNEKFDLDVKVINNQVEFHPTLNQKKLKQYCDKNSISVTAYSPIAQGKDLKLPEIREIANKYNKPESQVVLNWIIQKGMIAIPRSSDPQHIRENFNALQWELDQEDVNKIDQIEGNNRLVNPDFGEFDK